MNTAERERRIETIAWALALAACIVALFIASGCQTAAALQNAPEGAWVWVETVLVALANDLLSVFAIFL